MIAGATLTLAGVVVIVSAVATLAAILVAKNLIHICGPNEGLVFSGYHRRIDGTRLMEFIELPDHRFFIATQAHPEFKSRMDNPSPLFSGFVGASLAYQHEKADGDGEGQVAAS